VLLLVRGDPLVLLTIFLTREQLCTFSLLEIFETVVGIEGSLRLSVDIIMEASPADGGVRKSAEVENLEDTRLRRWGCRMSELNWSVY
jgi:hypothetical protein